MFGRRRSPQHDRAARPSRRKRILRIALAALAVLFVARFFDGKGLGCPVLNVGNPGEFTMLELAQLTLKCLPESKSKLVFQPLPQDDPKRRRPDISLAKEFLGWSPKVPLAEGLPKTIEYFKRFV